jgi:phosphatidylserine decarboxylase
VPASAGIAFVGGVQAYRQYATARDRANEEDDASLYEDDPEDQPEPGKKPKKRKRIKPEGPWQVRVMSTLPLKALSRAWGWFNSCDIPYYLRVPGFKLYSFIFGVKYVVSYSSIHAHILTHRNPA